MTRLLFVLALAACNSKGSAGSQCSADADCGSGLACVLQVCADPALSKPVDDARAKAQKDLERLQESRRELEAERTKLAAGADDVTALEQELAGLRKNVQDLDKALETTQEERDRKVLLDTKQGVEELIRKQEARLAELKSR
ncbi:hypothetical protein OV203_36960 [Nannocystis sp. ILAH1]|uniref:hypothetical protein n=1 Tax=unclassified Nannocystis TaxID=2627009 RepID=UPI00226E9C12|nr:MULTISPECIES: hypothetical protein [unclassified Nannocystis]MCY0992790.1 hypothetical protein [Nannocystis sp. ILAH1]MCY1069979.1 hypothetical protein [Nannocystis sp. RBIL2]